MKMSNSKKTKRKRRKVNIEVEKDEDFKSIYAIGALGGHTPWDFRIGFYNDSPKMGRKESSKKPTMKRNLLAEVMLSPRAAKELLLWLGTHVKQYEKQFGPIKVRKPKSGNQEDAPNQSSPRFPTYE